MKKISFLLVVLICIIAFTIPIKNADAMLIKNDNLVSGCRAALLMEPNTKQILYEYNADNKYPIASMVKIMTLNLIFDAVSNNTLKYNDEICISEYAASMGGSQAFLDVGETYKAENLIKSIIISSANDSCVALAEAISGSVDEFVVKMNQKADELGMKNTNYVNCTGLSADNAYSSARDVALSMNYLIQHGDYFKFSKIWMEDFIHPSGRITGLTNTNKLIRFYNGCDGGKTGYTDAAGHCLCATAYKNNMRLISVVIGGTESKIRFGNSSNLLNYGFAKYENKCMLSKNKDIATIKVKRGKTDEVAVGLNKDLYLFGLRGQNQGEVKYEYPNNLIAPIKANSIIGKAYVVDLQGKTIDSADIVTRHDVEVVSIWDKIKEIIKGN